MLWISGNEQLGLKRGMSWISGNDLSIMSASWVGRLILGWITGIDSML